MVTVQRGSSSLTSLQIMNLVITTWVQIPAPPLASLIVLGEALTSTGPWPCSRRKLRIPASQALCED